MQGERIWKGMAWTLAVGALAASLDTGLSARRHREILSAKEQDLRKIQAYAGRWAPEDALRAGLEERQAWTLVDLDELVTRALGAGAAKISPRAAIAVAGGWLRREAGVELRDVSYGEAALFLASAAESVPAWRLREIEISPSAQAGRGAMVLLLESLEKKRP